MPSYKLTYFNGKGRAEAARLMFAAAGQKYEDVRIKSEDWPKVKTGTPQGSLPVLNIDGTEICQSMAINRYIAREFKLYGKTNLEATVVDEILDTCLDMFLPLMKIFFNKNEEEKKQQMAEFMSEKVPVYLGNLEALIKQTGKDGFAVGSSITLADCVLHNYIDNCRLVECLEKYPLLAKNRKTFEALPKIKQYLDKRPKTDF